MTIDRTSGTIRVLVVARHPFRVEDMGLDRDAAVATVDLVRRTGQLDGALEESGADVVVVDTGFAEGRGFLAIEAVQALAPGAAVVALTPDPPPHGDLARAVRAGASGFVDIDAEPSEFAAAISAVHAGATWFPPEELRPVLAATADELDTIDSEHRSRLTGILLGLIPLTGLIAAIMAFFWRKYLGQIGVRPVDLAVDPASRAIDAIVGLLTVLGVFGPLLYVGTWLDLLRASAPDRGSVAWLLDHRKTAHVLLSLIVLGTTGYLAMGPDLAIVVVLGPMVTISVIAAAVDLSDELPPFLRIEISPRHIVIGGLAALFVFLAALAGEVYFQGPTFGPRGNGGVLVPRTLGFNATPMRAYELDTDNEPRDVLYLGGNADLYVLVDPCDDNRIDLVSVGRHRLEVIDEVTCPPANEP